MEKFLILQLLTVIAKTKVEMELFPTKLLLLIIFIKITNNFCQSAQIDFCNKELCPYQGVHVACGKNRTFSENCEGEVKLEDMRDYISLILDEHNRYRNQLAGGNVSDFDSAVRMPVLHWDWDLALTAEYHARTCIFDHDECRSTERFRLAGQNIFKSTTECLDLEMEYFIKDAIKQWFEEYRNVDRNLLQAYHQRIPPIGHFTVLVNDRQSHVGCSLLNNRLSDGQETRIIILICNYSTTNVYGFPTYKAGATASQCKERNEVFTNLCNDPIDANDLKWHKKE
uniref:SCP domain-containing protein n=1 Tax=Glossina austeni TaxID=7395 RepID=A0A1A9VG34_GLOAU